MPLIQLKIYIKAPVETVFNLSRDIDVHTRSVSNSRERAVAGVTSGLIGLGEQVTWEAVHFGVKQHLTSKITEFDFPNYFVDEMVRGAFKSFRHLHKFQPAEGGTLMLDEFDYKSPLGPLGVLADKLFLENYMRKLLLTRNLFIKEIAETSKPA